VTGIASGAERRRRCVGGLWVALASVLAGFLCEVAVGALPSDLGAGPAVLTLPAADRSHWIWINDFVFMHMADGQAHLVDGNTGVYLGSLSTGYSFGRVVVAHDGKLIYSPESYFSRGTRGVRTDVVTVYDSTTLNVEAEIVIPPKRSSNTPNVGNAALTDDDRFLLVYNFNPSQSVSVIDTKRREFVNEVETPGCSLVFPTGPRSFFSLCADGTLLSAVLDQNGKAVSQAHTEAFFDTGKDVVAEKPARLGGTWYFASYAGVVYPIRAVGLSNLTLDPRFSLVTAEERRQGWRPGGLQQLAVHGGENRLYAIMHQGGLNTHKDAGKSVWVFDLTTHRRVARIPLVHPATSIRLTSDQHPVMFAVNAESSALEVYDPRSGRLLRTVSDIGSTPTLLVPADGS
jgi:methylamine dehydrogenase heavy chain